MNKYQQLRTYTDPDLSIIIQSINEYKCIMMKRILEEATARASSEINLHSQNCISSGEQFASPSAELNRDCITSPPKLWHNLSNICN